MWQRNIEKEKIIHANYYYKRKKLLNDLITYVEKLDNLPLISKFTNSQDIEKCF